MSDYVPISCRLHDHVELACLRRYKLRIGTRDELIVGTAITTRTDPDKREWLVLERDGRQTELRLDRIRSLEPLDDDAAFAQIRFGEDGADIQ